MLKELGSGLAQFILVLANAATRRPPPSFILIDEPELSLHPKLQIDFLTTLGEYATNGVLFATHSVGLARSCAEYIYSIRVTENGRREIRDFEETKNLAEFLGELNFSAYRELGFDKVLLVEGAHDVLVLQQFLRKLKKDRNAVLIHLGGGALIKDSSEIHLDELKRITPHIFALIDSEKDDENAPLSSDREGFAKNCRVAGIDCHVLERRAIENYFTERAIQTVKSPKYSALQPFEKLKDPVCHNG
jgi:predicted ATP-dependent endonuclease of OLD family